MIHISWQFASVHTPPYGKLNDLIRVAVIGRSGVNRTISLDVRPAQNLGASRNWSIAWGNHLECEMKLVANLRDFLRILNGDDVAVFWPAVSSRPVTRELTGLPLCTPGLSPHQAVVGAHVLCLAWPSVSTFTVAGDEYTPFIHLFLLHVIWYGVF